MVVNAIYPHRYWKAGPVVCRHVWLSQLSFRPYALLPPETWIWIHPQNSPQKDKFKWICTVLSVFIMHLRVVLWMLEGVIRWHVARFYRCFSFAFTSLTSLVPRVLVLASLAMDSCFPLTKSRQVQFSLVLHWGQLLQRQKFLSRSHWTVCWI